MRKNTTGYIKALLMSLLVIISVGAILFSVIVLVSDFGKDRTVSSAQARAEFTQFAYRYINEVHPRQPAPGHTWSIDHISFNNDNFAVVETTDGVETSTLEFIYMIEGKNVRVLKINDATRRDLEDAQNTLIHYLGSLRDGNYAEAVPLYGGSRDRLTNATSSAPTMAQLFATYCTSANTYHRCLPFVIDRFASSSKPNEYTATVRYFEPSSKILTLNDGRSTFTGTVVQLPSNEFRVTSLPFD